MDKSIVNLLKFDKLTINDSSGYEFQTPVETKESSASHLNDSSGYEFQTPVGVKKPANVVHTSADDNNPYSFIPNILKKNGLYSCYDILNYVGRKSGKKRFVDKCKSETTFQYESIFTKTGERKGGLVQCASVENIKILVLFHILTARPTEEERKKLFSEFNLEGATMESGFLPRAETQTISIICRALPFKAEPNKHVGTYYIDCYFPGLRIALECDEYGHKNYNKVDEEARQKFIQEQLGCTFVRYDPYEEEFDVLVVIRDIISSYMKSLMERLCILDEN